MLAMTYERRCRASSGPKRTVGYLSHLVTKRDNQIKRTMNEPIQTLFPLPRINQSQHLRSHICAVLGNLGDSCLAPCLK